MIKGKKIDFRLLWVELRRNKYLIAIPLRIKRKRKKSFKILCSYFFRFLTSLRLQKSMAFFHVYHVWSLIYCSIIKIVNFFKIHSQKKINSRSKMFVRKKSVKTSLKFVDSNNVLMNDKKNTDHIGEDDLTL